MNIIDHMVNRFLGWKLPKHFTPDAGISFKPTKPYEGDEYGNSWWPVGTNLFTADQAREMFEYCLHAAPDVTSERDAVIEECARKAETSFVGWPICGAEQRNVCAAEIRALKSQPAKPVAAPDPRDEVIRQQAEALKVARQMIERGRDYSEQLFSGYGMYRTDNPHDFSPDPECCTPEEIANHKAACEAFDNGTYTPDNSDGWISPNVHITKAPWGIGFYSGSDPDFDKALAAIDSLPKKGG